MLVPRILVPADAPAAKAVAPKKTAAENRAWQMPVAPREAQQAAPPRHGELFAEALLEKSRTKPRHRVPDLVISLCVHALLLVGLILVPLYFTEAIDIHRFNETLLVAPPTAPPPPAPPAAAAVARPAAAPKKLLPEAGKLVVPRVVPNQVARPAEEPGGSDVLAAMGPGVGLPGGVPDGQANGVIGGILSGASPSAVLPAPVASAPKGPVRVGGEIRAPRLLLRAEPNYPLLARQAKLSGDVVIDAVIDPQGNVVEMHVLSGHPLLIPAAMDALRHWKYEPTTVNGQPVAVQLTVTISFRLT